MHTPGELAHREVQYCVREARRLTGSEMDEHLAEDVGQRMAELRYLDVLGSVSRPLYITYTGDDRVLVGAGESSGHAFSLFHSSAFSGGN